MNAIRVSGTDTHSNGSSVRRVQLAHTTNGSQSAQSVTTNLSLRLIGGSQPSDIPYRSSCTAHVTGSMYLSSDLIAGNQLILPCATRAHSTAVDRLLNWLRMPRIPGPMDPLSIQCELCARFRQRRGHRDEQCESWHTKVCHNQTITVHRTLNLCRRIVGYGERRQRKQIRIEAAKKAYVRRANRFIRVIVS